MSEPDGGTPLRRIAAGIEYRGTAYDGWQRQASSGQTVQDRVERALSRVADHEVNVQCAGRTDAGVHAVQQVIHFDTAAARADHAWVLGANSNLPRDIALLWATQVDGEFHARFSARWRRYVYLILNRPVRTATYHRLLSWERRPLDVAVMAAAAGELVGEHDFSSYRAVACQAASPVRTVRRLEVSRRGDLVSIDIEANAFLHHMVRNIAGVLTAIGSGRAGPDWAGEVLNARDRTLGGITAPPDGLYLVNVFYGHRFGIPVADWCPDHLVVVKNV